MAAIELTAKLEGSAEANAVPIRVMSVTATLSGRASGNLQRPPQAQPAQEKPKS